VNVDELKEQYGDAPECHLTKMTISELLEGKPVHIENCILIPPGKNMDTEELYIIAEKVADLDIVGSLGLADKISGIADKLRGVNQ